MRGSGERREEKMKKPNKKTRKKREEQGFEKEKERMFFVPGKKARKRMERERKEKQQKAVRWEGEERQALRLPRFLVVFLSLSFLSCWLLIIISLVVCVCFLDFRHTPPPVVSR